MKDVLHVLEVLYMIANLVTIIQIILLIKLTIKSSINRFVHRFVQEDSLLMLKYFMPAKRVHLNAKRAK